MPSIAMVITAKNERVLLRQNILFHRYLGIEKFYVFLDNSTDDTCETVTDLLCVKVSPSISPDRFLHAESRRKAAEHSPILIKCLENWNALFPARQMLNTYVALERAAGDGHDWLVFIDADELACPDIHAATGGQLACLLDRIDPAVEQVRFTTLEVVQQARKHSNVFAEARLFKGAGSRVRRDSYDPFEDRIRRYYVYDGGRYPRVKRFSWWYGHRLGKCAVRVGASAVPNSSHRFQRIDGKKFITENGGFLLHYFIYDADDFLKKYKNLESSLDRYVSGYKVDYRNRLWREVVNSTLFSTDWIRDYYRRWIAFDEERIEELRNGGAWMGAFRRSSDVIEVAAVCNVFGKLQKGRQLA